MATTPSRHTRSAQRRATPGARGGTATTTRPPGPTASSAPNRPAKNGTATKTPSRPISATPVVKRPVKANVAPSTKADVARPVKANVALSTKADVARPSVAPVSTPAPKAPLTLRLVDTLASVQGEKHDARERPRWFKISTWLLVLMPAFSIVIFIVGFFYFLPFEQRGVGINPSFSVTATATLGDVLIPDQEGLFIQHGASNGQGLSLLYQFNSRTLQPPADQQYTIKGDNLKYILIYQAQVELPEAYQVYRISLNDTASDRLVKVVGKRVTFPRKAIISLAMPNGQAWAPGNYMVVVPEAGMDSADNWYFFTVN